MKCASSRTSAGEKFSSSVHLGMSACICGANLVASPRYSRCARRCWGMAAGHYAATLFFPAAPRAHRRGEGVEQRARVLPAEAGVGDALAEDEGLALLQLLASLDQVRLDHHPDDAPLAAGELRRDVARDVDLPPVLLGGV